MADEKIIFSMVGVSKTFTNQKRVLNNIYLSFFYGAKIGIIGLNGSGKSTLMKIIAGIDKLGERYDEFPVYTKVFDMPEKPDVIIDFSHPSALPDLLSYGKMNNVPLVLATTGYTDEERAQITAASAQVPVFFTFNMSLGINLLVELARKATQILGGQFDIEIVEKHHNLKLDAPSGTALMIADGISEQLDEDPQYVYDRHSYRRKRSKNEIGIHSVRGGTIVGEHEVIFAGHDEVVTISHQAQSKEVFAVGAVNAEVFIKDQKAGMYNMGNLLSEKMN